MRLMVCAREDPHDEHEWYSPWLRQNCPGVPVAPGDPCPYDTNGDGDCGKYACPHCGVVRRPTP